MLRKCWSFSSSRIGVSTCQLQKLFYSRSPSWDAEPGQSKWLDDYGAFSESLGTHHQVHRMYKKKPAVLLMNNYESHLSLEVVEMAWVNGLSIVTFPPQYPHRLQPLDVSFYGPLKSY